MKLLWLNWKDTKHPHAGGAEVVNHALMKRLVADGHTVTLVTARYPGSSATDVVDGVNIIRVGRSRYTHSFVALWYYLTKLRNQFDAVVETVNTAPYLTSLFPGTARHILFYHMLAKEIWMYETSFPLNFLGRYILEPVANWLQSRTSSTVITVSQSSKDDLIASGFDANAIHIVSEGIELAPVASLAHVKKYTNPTILSLGAVRAMKQTDQIVTAFEILRDTTEIDVRLIIAGGVADAYGEQVLEHIKRSPHRDVIGYRGWVSEAEKIELMQHAHIIAVTSVKEGWGLIVTEANSQGTLAVVYNVCGLRDSVQHNRTGLVAEQNTPEALAKSFAVIFSDPKRYNQLQLHAWQWSKQITFDQCYEDFKKHLY